MSDSPIERVTPQDGRRRRFQLTPVYGIVNTVPGRMHGNGSDSEAVLRQNRNGAIFSRNDQISFSIQKAPLLMAVT